MIATHCLFPFILQFLKCITAKHFGTMEHLVTVASRIEAVWIGKFTFRPAERKEVGDATRWPTGPACGPTVGSAAASPNAA